MIEKCRMTTNELRTLVKTTKGKCAPPDNTTALKRTIFTAFPYADSLLSFRSQDPGKWLELTLLLAQKPLEGTNI